MKKATSLRNSLTLHFVTLATLPSLLLGVLGGHYFERKLQGSYVELIRTHAVNVSNEASWFLDEANARLGMIRRTLATGLLSGDGEINRYLLAEVGEASFFEAIYIVDQRHLVTHMGRSDGSNVSDYIGLDMSGQGILGPRPQQQGPAWSDTFISATSAEPSVNLGLPLGERTLVGTINLKRLSADLVGRLTQVKDGFHFSLIDHHGVLIADSRQELVQQRINLRGHPEVRNALDKGVEVDAKLHEDSSLMESVRLVGETGWVAYVSLPMEEVRASIVPLRYMLVSYVTLAAGLGLLLALWISRRLVRPILQVRDAARAVTRGSYDQILQQARHEELEELSASFREMIAAVEEREHAILESRARFSELVNSIDGIVWELDLAEFRFTFVSRQAENLLGYPVRQWLEEKDFWQNHIFEEDRDWAVSYCMAETEARRDHDFEYRMVAVDGRVVWLKDVVSVHCVGGRPVSLRGVMLDISMRKKAEIHLLETTTRLQLLVSRMPFGCIVWSNDNRVVLWNKAAERIFGLGETTAVGRTVDEIVPVDRTISGQRRDLALPPHDVTVHEMPNGRTVTCEWNNTPLIVDDGSPQGVISIVQDISLRVIGETALKESEARFRSLASVMGEGVLILDHDGEVVMCNRAAERILGISAAEAVGQIYHELLPHVVREDGTPYRPEDRPAAVTLLSGSPFENYLMGLVRGDGEQVWLQVNSHPLGLDRDGLPTAVVVSFADVTRLKRTETELRENEKHLQVLSQQFRGVLEAIPDQIMILDREMHLVWLNRRFDKGLAGQVEFTGVSCRAMPEIPCGEGGGNRQALCDECPVRQVFASGKNMSQRLDLDGGRTLSLRAFPIRDVAGEVINVIATVQDISESVQQQARSMRTGQLAALGELAAGVAHEINNPINGVINYAQLILNRAAGESRERDLAQRIIKESERVATIVRELLYFAREESSEVNLIRVADALDEALALTRSQLYREGVTLRVELPDTLPLVCSRSHQIQQLFLNLISNARHALTEKYRGADPEKVLQISGECVNLDGRRQIRIVLRDQGVGIPADMLSRIMNPFVTTKPSGEGTGLGLSISHEIVQKHGGSLTIDSVHGEYTEVVVVLPAAEDDGRAQDSANLSW